jgi:hypothetical protein
MSTTAQGVEPTLALSLYHLPTPAQADLPTAAPSLRVNPVTDGWEMYVPEHIPGDVPAPIRRILDRATELDCWWVRFDHGIEPCTDLPTFDDALAAAA